MREGTKWSQGQALTRYGSCEEPIGLLHMVQAVWPAVRLLDEQTLPKASSVGPVKILPFAQES